MKSVLWDTNVLSYLLAGDLSFKHGLEKASGDFGDDVAMFISTVTIQELMVFAMTVENTAQTSALLSKFNALSFTEPCALEAARILAQSKLIQQKKKTGTKSAQRDAKDRWQRDAAIAGTASHHKLDYIFTANVGDFRPFEALILPCVVYPCVATNPPRG